MYTALVGTNGTQTDTSWFAAPQPNYYITLKGNSPNSGAAFDLTFHYLNDTASVGYSWQYKAGQGNGFTAHIKTTIKERGISMIVEGKTYTNVIHTELVLSYDLFGIILDFGSYDYYVSKGVGIIKVRTEVASFGVAFSACTNLIDHKIN